MILKIDGNRWSVNPFDKWRFEANGQAYVIDTYAFSMVDWFERKRWTNI